MNRYFVTIVAAVAFVFVANYFVLAVFQEPTPDQLPPGEAENVPAPVNVGTTFQKKMGDLEAQTVWSDRLAGEGRPRAGVINANGECRVGSVKVSRSDRSVPWTGAASACPRGWWVCSVTDRGAGACKTSAPGDNQQGALSGYDCQVSGQDNYDISNTFRAWVADAAVGTGGKRHQGIYVKADDGTQGDEQSCSQYPVWCCSNL